MYFVTVLHWNIIQPLLKDEIQLWVWEVGEKLLFAWVVKGNLGRKSEFSYSCPGNSLASSRKLYTWKLRGTEKDEHNDTLSSHPWADA